MQYNVTVRKRPLDGFKGAYLNAIYTVYGNSPEDAANSLIIQKKAASKKDIIMVTTQEAY